MAGLIGYARVSTGGQSVQRQVDELRKAGCAEVLEETASGADRSRPVLAALLRRIRQGETLVVVKLDRLARSLEHLLDVVRTLEASGAWLRVLGDPIDTATSEAEKQSTFGRPRGSQATEKAGSIFGNRPKIQLIFSLSGLPSFLVA